MTSDSPKTLSAGDHLYLVDGSTFIFRAYHALPPLTRKSDGLPVGAVSGFCNMLYKLLQDNVGGERPSHLAVIFDYSGKTFRNDIYSEYKAHRPPAPEDLVPQFGLIRQAVKAFSVPSIEMEGYEADDLIATYARQAEAQGATVTIISSDKDLMQLVSDKISMRDTMKNRDIGREQVLEKFEVGPERVIDVQSLAGDSVDNVPGVPGIGVKTAALLINEYGDLDTLLERAGEIKQNKRRENLIEFADQARVSRDLVTLKTDVPVKKQIGEFAIQAFEASTLIGFLKALEFTTLTKRIASSLDADADAIEPTELQVEFDGRGPDTTPEQSAQADGAGVSIADIPFDRSKYETITTTQELAAWVEKAAAAGKVAVDTETSALDAMQADLVGVSLSIEPGAACYIPLGHRAGDDLFDEGGSGDQIPMEQAIALLKPLLEDQSVLKIGQNLKYDILVLKRYGIDLVSFDDTMLLSYALNSGVHSHGMDELSNRYLSHQCIPFSQVAGSGKSQISFARVAIDKATEYAAEDADVTLRLYEVLKPRLAFEKVATVYQTLERPLVPVIVQMEREGVKVDRSVLSRLSGEFAQKMAGMEEEIYKLTGEKFNINSPKQLGEILFDKMALPGGKKTKTGAWGTSASVLEDLSVEGHELPGKVLEWRSLAKLKSTYTDALPEFINPDTGRVHTSYSLAATTTGRLSSSEPNLQNIPIRTEDGRKIRKAFIAEPGHKLISADYSQIELRILAEIADIGALKQAFADGLDIHAMTASEMFGVPLDEMDPATRRRAKAINFGIIYGISAFGLANQLGISRGEARDYIETYFERFPGIKTYMEETKAWAREKGYVKTLFGRICHTADINSKNPSQRAFVERAAINAPIQGSAADIIRRAMIRMSGALENANLNARMLLQVHDELIFETPEKEVDETIALVSKIMEQASLPALKLSVPLKVDARAADNWDEAH